MTLSGSRVYSKLLTLCSSVDTVAQGSNAEPRAKMNMQRCLSETAAEDGKGDAGGTFDVMPKAK